MSFDFGGFYLAGTGVASGSGGAATPTTLAALTDVNLGVLSNGEVLRYNSVSGKWENASGGSFGGLTGTLAARPLAPTSDTIYLVNGDATIANNGRTFLYLLANAAWIELDTKITNRIIDDLIDVDTTTTPPVLNDFLGWDNVGLKWVPKQAGGVAILKGTLAARPVAPTSNTLYVVDGDATAANNGKSYIYDTLGAVWIELDTKITNRVIDDLLDVDTTTTPPAAGDVLTWDNIGLKWKPATGAAGSPIYTGTLAARPATYLINSLYIVSGDPTASNNGKTYLYDTVSTTWIELDTKITNRVIDDLLDVDTITTPPVNGDVLAWNNTGLVWEPKTLASNLALAKGTLAARPLAPLVDTIYVVDGDATAANNGLTSIYFISVPGWIELDTKITNRKIDDLIDVDTTTNPAVFGQVLQYDGVNWVNEYPSTAQIGTLGARPASLNANGWYLVDGDATAENNGRLFLYDLGLAAWVEVDTKITNRKIDDLIDVDTTTNAPLTNQALVWDGTNWIPGSVSGAFTGTFAARPASYTANTLYIVSGDTVANNGRSFLYDTGSAAWIELDTKITNRNLDDLLDVDVTTTPPVAGNGIAWDAVGLKWVTNPNNWAQPAIGFTTATPPAFATILPGTIWIDPNTLDQYIYVIDGGGTNQWITLGQSSPVGGGSTLAGLSDVDLATTPPINGDVLSYNNFTGLWEPAPAGGLLSINQLTDVDTVTTPPVNTNLLQYNGTNWVPIAYPTIPTNLDALSDVDTTTTPPVNNDILKYNGTNWIPGANTPSITSNQATATTATISAGAWTTIATLNTVNGTCLFNYNIRYAGSGATVLKARLYDSTGSATITNSEVYVTRNGLGIDEGSYSGTCIGTLGAASTIQLQVYVTGSACDIKSDVDGRTLINYMRIS